MLGWTVAGAGMVASGLARGSSPAKAAKPFDILFLGGTGFIGPYQVEHALARGHRVTLFNRGRSAATLFQGKAELLVGNRDSRVDQGLSALKGDRTWELVIDNSGYLPRHVRESVDLLKGRTRRYIYVSSVAVYGPGNTAPSESSTLQPLPDPTNEEFSWQRYGPLKAECDRIVQAALGAKATIVRPCFIVGPKDETDRFTYWVDRVARGGDVLGPSTPKSELQWVDVRDLCPWIVGLGERDIAGIFNAAGPASPWTWEQMLNGLAPLAKEPVRFHWATDEILTQLQIELPLAFAGRSSRHFDNKASQAAGLNYRPLADTATAILEWWRAQPAERRARVEDWPTPEKERAAIARLSATAVG